jgi:serine/threonine-protein kinase
MRLDSLAEVARGGMGSVELARVLDGRLTGQILAVKRLHPNIAEDPEFVSMFLDEAWMTAALKHPNVAQVVAWGNDEKGMFLAIELVQGVSLSRLMKESQQNQEPFAERTVAFICSQICAGLVAAHTLTTPDGAPLGLVHRDLTPANVLVSFDGMVKIIDFGIAKAEERISHTRTGQLKGKPAYMAPEQQRGGAVDARADLFAFGVLMFEMLAGRRPWTAKGAFDVMMEISSDPHPDLGELRKGLNPEFVAIAHKCLAKKPEDRFQTAREIKGRLDAWLSARGFSSDDQQSLANFVLRNSQPQVLWWQEALRGEHSKKKAPTFKELEEKIDEEREKKARAAKKAAAPPPPRPAAGTQPMRQAPPQAPQQPPRAGTELMPPSAPAPQSLPQGQGLSGTVAISGPQSMGQPQSLRSSASHSQMAAVLGPPASVRHPQAQPAQPPSSGKPKIVTGAGTEFMMPSVAPGQLPPASQHYGAPQSVQPQSVQPQSAQPQSAQPQSAQPISSQPISSQPQPSSQQPPSGMYPVYAGAAASPQQPYGPQAVPVGTESGTIPMAPGLPIGAAGTGQHQPLGPGNAAARITMGSAGNVPSPMGPQAAPYPAPAEPALVPQPPPPPPAPVAAPKKSRAPLIVILIAVPLLAAAAGAWMFRAELGLDSPPRATPSGKSK